MKGLKLKARIDTDRNFISHKVVKKFKSKLYPNLELIRMAEGSSTSKIAGYCVVDLKLHEYSSKCNQCFMK